jgi:hypothetical protein
MTQLYKDIKRLLKLIYLMIFYSSVFVKMSLILAFGAYFCVELHTVYYRVKENKLSRYKQRTKDNVHQFEKKVFTYIDL